MGTNYANQDDNISQGLIDYYVAKAKSGSRLITIEATAVDSLGKTIVKQLGLWSDEHIAEFKNLVDTCHKYGARVSVQLHCASGEVNALFAGICPASSSPLPCAKGLELPHELTTEEIYALIQKFAAAAKKCRDAGVDAVEVAAHEYLIGQFLSPNINKRVDEFGGNFENRIRFFLLIIQGIRQQVDNTYPIIVRVGDLSMVEIGIITGRLKSAGVNAILVSANYGYSAYLAAKIRNSIRIPVVIKYLLLPLADALNHISQRIFCRLARRTAQRFL